MANYIATYDLNGSTPTHKQMDDHIAKAGWDRGRILETVWYIGTAASRDDVYEHLNAILTANGRLLVVDAPGATWRNLLLDGESLKQAWVRNA